MHSTRLYVVRESSISAFFSFTHWIYIINATYYIISNLINYIFDFFCCRIWWYYSIVSCLWRQSIRIPLWCSFLWGMQGKPLNHFSTKHTIIIIIIIVFVYYCLNYPWTYNECGTSMEKKLTLYLLIQFALIFSNTKILVPTRKLYIFLMYFFPVVVNFSRVV